MQSLPVDIVERRQRVIQAFERLKRPVTLLATWMYLSQIKPFTLYTWLKRPQKEPSRPYKFLTGLATIYVNSLYPSL